MTTVIKFKKEGDGFLVDCWADGGYTYAFYFRNDLPPAKYKATGLSALHKRCLAIYDSLPHKNYKVWTDNLYTSYPFILASLKHPAHVMVEGVCRKGKRGVPDCIKQEEVPAHKKRKLAEVVGTLKAAVTYPEEYPEHAVISVSLYDKKPVYLMSSAATSIKWTKKLKKVWTGEETNSVEFFRLDMIDSYNHNMGSVDIADQLRNSYRFDTWMRLAKWWWPIFFWGWGVEMVNAYNSYKRHLISNGIKEKDIMTQYDFRKDYSLDMLGYSDTKKGLLQFNYIT